MLPYNKSLRLCVSAFFLLTLLNCQQQEQHPTTPHLGFYHWQTNLKLNEKEQSYLDSLPIQKLYVKFFDVDWDFTQQRALPHATLIVNTTLPATLEIIPTIFITNRTFQHLPSIAIEELVNKVKGKIEQQFEQFPTHQLSTIQIDCDWSLSTQVSYFQFLEKLQQAWQATDRTLSTTIRLHQIKYFQKTGVPPVNRGLLMFYNMGEVKTYETTNSILDIEIAKKYTDYLSDYPLSLDIALPLFQWGVVFRDRELVQLINQLTREELMDTTRFQSIDTIRWRVLISTYIRGQYVYEGDIIRLETSPYGELEEAVRLLQPFFDGEDFDLVFYHFEEEVLGHFSVLEVDSLVGCW